MAALRLIAVSVIMVRRVLRQRFLQANTKIISNTLPISANSAKKMYLLEVPDQNGYHHRLSPSFLLVCPPGL